MTILAWMLLEQNGHLSGEISIMHASAFIWYGCYMDIPLFLSMVWNLTICVDVNKYQYMS